MQEPDPTTIRAAADGDLDAFEALVRAYQAEVWRFLRHLLGDPALAEDVAQETFLRVFTRLRSFRFQSKFSTWLFQVARNAGLDALRARSRRDRLAQRLHPAANVPSPEATTEVAAAVAALTDRLREPLLLVEVLGLTYAEAATVLDLPVGTVKSRVHTARQRLSAWLEEPLGAAGAEVGQ